MGQIPTTPAIIPVPFAANGQKSNIPETVDTPGAPNASWSAGFPSITMINRQAGGKPPLGMDFNGVLSQLSNNAFFAQSGGLYPWDAALDYLTNAHVQGSDGEEYIAVTPSGPDVPAAGSGFVGAQDPTADTANTYWISAAAKFGAPVASTTVRGVARLATQAEVQAGAAAAGSSAPAVLRPEDIAAFPAVLGGAMLYNTREVLTTSGSWTAPVTGWMRGLLIAGGAGGGGGNNSGGFQSGGGGGAGEELEFFFFVTAGQTISYTIGAAGNGGPVNTNGTDGGDSTVTIDGVTRTAHGGEHGSRANARAGMGGGTGLSAGASGGGPTSGTGNSAVGGTGGGRGGGVAGSAPIGPGDGVGYGSGGSGGVGRSTSYGGGNGMQGCFVIDYFDPSKVA